MIGMTYYLSTSTYILTTFFKEAHELIFWQVFNRSTFRLGSRFRESKIHHWTYGLQEVQLIIRKRSYPVSTELAGEAIWNTKGPVLTLAA